MQPPSQQSLNSLQGSQPLPSINENGAQHEEGAPLPPLAPRHSRKRSTNSGMEATSAEMLAPGSAPSFTEEPTPAFVIPAAANGAMGANTPKPPLANRPRPPAIHLYPSANLQPTQITPNQEAGHNPQGLSPRPSIDASEDAEECGSVVFHPGRQSMPPVWSTSPVETPSSAIVNATPFYQSDLLQGCPSPPAAASTQELPSTAASLTAAALSPRPSQQQHTQQGEGMPPSSIGARPRSLDSGAAAKANHHEQQQPQQQQQQLPEGQTKRRRQTAASWDSGTSPLSASAATINGGLGGFAVRHAQSTSYDTIGTTDITLAPPPFCTLTAGTDTASATAAAAAAAAAAAGAKGQHFWGHPEQQPALRDSVEAQVCTQDKRGEMFMNHNPLAHLPTRTDPMHLPPRTYPMFETVSQSEDGGGDLKGQKEGLERVDGHTAAQLAEAVAAANRAHAEERATAGGEESMEDVMSGRITVVEEDVMSGRVTVVEEDESGEALAAREHDEEQREEGDAQHRHSCGSCDNDDNPEREQERALIGAADSAAVDDAEAAADRAALSVGCGFGAAFGIGGSARGLGASSAAHASANFTVTHTNSLYAHGDSALGHGGVGDGALNGAGGMGVDGVGVAAEPAPELMPAPKTWHSTLDMLWDWLSLALFLLALILDIVALASFAANNCGREWWVPTILFILAHTTFMGLVLLIHSQWAKRCWRSFIVVLNGPECIALRTPWCSQSSARFLLYVPQFFIALITLAIGSMVSAFVLGGIILSAVCAVPLLDLSAAAATIWPAGDKKRFRSQDLLFLENFKLARYSLQAVLQSLPQIILLAISLSSLGPINGKPSETAQCNAPEGVAIAALAVASLNVLDKLFQSGLQVGQCMAKALQVRLSGLQVS
ncbi:hypothetical protein DUNSADRAFT_13078 [Dunaliella salina]|uniref:XK-related protein n=1 Tax=Dunaliella salina TaxID=3046 RepID=A0ABQ7H3J2_DUNSA|nr:hypothetical protein DUNSADRAFT_13078 [Dunaliella salina]KAF5841416.1 hypothetical protein DUNSADRAFT_13078 [Dunaliella salina]|eukprot:KAF5841415.1 hypothetical protein DUNSADRAFT_13078 [Dunaliella salina]